MICPLVAGISSPLLLKATVRAAKRIFQSEDDLNVTGTKVHLISRVLGDSDDGITGTGLLEIGERFCKTGVPDCKSCRLNGICITGKDVVSSGGQVQLVRESGTRNDIYFVRFLAWNNKTCELQSQI